MATAAFPNVQAATGGPTQVWMKDEQGQWVANLLLRKTVKIDQPIAANVEVISACPYEIYCNGYHAGSGSPGTSTTSIDVSSFLRNGDNVIAVRSRRITADQPGIGVRLRYHTALTKQSVETDSTWLSAQRALPLWKTPLYSDRTWSEAVVIGPGSSLPATLAVPSALAAGGNPGSLPNFPHLGADAHPQPMSNTIQGTEAQLGGDSGNAQAGAALAGSVQAQSTVAASAIAGSNATRTQVQPMLPGQIANDIANQVATQGTDGAESNVMSAVSGNDLASTFAALSQAAKKIPDAQMQAQQMVDQAAGEGRAVMDARKAEIIARAKAAQQNLSNQTQGTAQRAIARTDAALTALTQTAATAESMRRSAVDTLKTMSAEVQTLASGSGPGVAAGSDSTAALVPELDTQNASAGSAAPATPGQDLASTIESAMADPTSPGGGIAATEFQQAAEPGESNLSEDIQLRVPENFVVEPIASSAIGSLIAIEFDEFGRILASRETGGLIRIDLTVPLENPKRVTEVCSNVRAIQGILPLNGQIYVTGVGPAGLGLYLLSDKDGDFVYEQTQKVCGFSGAPGEHGPHAINLGTDRMLYVLLGNHTQVEGPIAASSLVKHFYEGDSVRRYEDPSGHAVGIKSPGGTLVRISLDGKTKEIVAGGIRNAYDFAFNTQGDIFLHDSDMESDEGTSWYRPTQVFHVTGGAELGWRSGWAKWPSYYLDAIPPMAETGRGSPSGCAIYDHVRFPKSYRGALFLADWSNGKIMSARPEIQGATYQTKVETFMEGRPLNVTDLAVGPEDGALYISLGGRDSAGGIYRVRYTGEIAPQLTTYNTAWEEVIRTPLFYSAAARQRIATLRQELSASWDQTLISIVESDNNVDAYRLRALNVMQWFGPAIELPLLQKLASTQSPAVRAKVASILGTREATQAQGTLIAMLSDSDAAVQRVACESLARLQVSVPPRLIQPLLASDDRVLAFAARRVLENQDPATWSELLDDKSEVKVFAQASIAAMIAQPSLKNAYQILVGVTKRLDQNLSKQEYLDLMRATQLALSRGEVDASKVPAFAQRVAQDFPTNDSQTNRELVYVLTYLKQMNIGENYVAYLQNSDVPFVDRFHLAVHMPEAGQRMDAQVRMAFLEFLETATTRNGGGSYEHYVIQAARELAKTIPADQAVAIVDQGERFPNAALMMLSQLPKPLTDASLQSIAGLEEKLANRNDPAARELKIGLVAVLGESLTRNPQAAAQLISIWKNDPNRREFVALAMAQCPPKSAVQNTPAPVVEKFSGLEVKPQQRPLGEALRLASQATPQPSPLQPLGPADAAGDRDTDDAGEAAAMEGGDIPVHSEQFWTYLIQSLPVLTGNSAGDVFDCLSQMERTSKHPDHIRQIILLGAQYPNVASAADPLLQKWTQQSITTTQPGRVMAEWQNWFARQYPNELPATVPNQHEAGKWTIAAIEKELGSLKGNPVAGADIYVQTQCASCHALGSSGSSIGPELSTVARRFHRREIIEAIVYPSKTISDRYRSEIVMTDDGKVYAGIVTQIADGKIAIIDRDARRTEIAKADISEMKKSSQSIMPSRLLESLTPQQIADLFAYLETDSESGKQQVAETPANPPIAQPR